MLASPSLKGWPLSSLRFEAEPGSLSLRLAPCAAQVLQGSGCPVTPPARLHVSQAFHMVNSFQFTREVRLRLTHQRAQRIKREAAENIIRSLRPVRSSPRLRVKRFFGDADQQPLSASMKRRFSSGVL